jgi:pyrroloquinoline quinone biosynthesis protein B
VDDGTTLLFDASPDLRLQYQRLNAFRDSRPRSPFDAVFITHGHMGHYAGLVHFGKEAANTSGVPLHADPSVIEFLSMNQPWAALFENGNILPSPVASSGADAAVEFGSIRIVSVPVPHRVDFTATSAYSIEVDGSPWVLYLPDIDSWDAWPEAREVLARHELCLVDATFGSVDELPGRDITQIPHPLVTDTIERFADLTSTTGIVLTHINHSNALNDASSELALAARDRGFAVARDGLTFERGALL